MDQRLRRQSTIHPELSIDRHAVDRQAIIATCAADCRMPRKHIIPGNMMPRRCLQLNPTGLVRL